MVRTAVAELRRAFGCIVKGRVKDLRKFSGVTHDNCLMFFFKQKTAYDLTEGDWSSDVCSSDLTSSQPGSDEVGRLFGGLKAMVDKLRGTIRSEERRVGKECPQLCRSWWSSYHQTKKICAIRRVSQVDRASGCLHRRLSL